LTYQERREGSGAEGNGGINRIGTVTRVAVRIGDRAPGRIELAQSRAAEAPSILRSEVIRSRRMPNESFR
jgi:hypothetical protein